MYKNKKGSQLPSYDHRLSSDSVVPLDNGLQEVYVHKGPKRSGTKVSVMDVTDKKLQRKQLIMLLVGMFVDVVLPIVLYYTLKSHISLLAALLISSAPPAIWVVVKYFVYRRVDPLGFIIIFGFVLSAILSAVDGDPRVLLLRDSFVTGATGLIFLGSLLPIKTKKFELKPITYGISAQMMAASPKVRYIVNGETIEQERSEFCWQWSHNYRFGMRMMTGVWAGALLTEFAIRVVMYFSSLTVDQMVLYGNVVLGATLGTAAIITTVSSSIIRKKTIKEVESVKAQLERENEEWEAVHLLPQHQSAGPNDSEETL
ncbi:hypothetical protein BGX21_004579 [Mortierella sp. AD011]|nr:hypothetical protein BGX20_004550 [Mortierella sp. AD010]KAF9373071.1 hypothetical protein BGX21_004579 [Mortierella sp. AD011]